LRCHSNIFAATAIITTATASFRCPQRLIRVPQRHLTLHSGLVPPTVGAFGGFLFFGEQKSGGLQNIKNEKDQERGTESKLYHPLSQKEKVVPYWKQPLTGITIPLYRAYIHYRCMYNA
jgi:hypothetical protein